MTILAFIIVGLIRLVFNDFRLSFGAGDSRSILRHTEHVLRKSVTACIFTAIMLAAVLGIFSLFSATTAMTAVYAVPVLFVVEFGWRQVRSSRIKAEEAQRNQRK
jgi:hypothetical protein